MKKSLFISACVLLMGCLTACNDPNVAQTAKNLGLDQLGEIGSNLAVNAIKNECENQLNNGQGVVDLVLSAEQKANICTCVSDDIKNNLTADKLSEVIKDGKVQTQVLTTMVTGAMAKCTAPVADQAQVQKSS